MAWLTLFIAGLFEIGWAVGLKYTEGFTRLVPTVLTLASMTVSVYLLSVAMKSLPIGTSYAVWTGIGSVGTILFGIFLFHEGINVAKALCFVMIVCGILGLKLTSA